MDKESQPDISQKESILRDIRKQKKLLTMP